MAQHDYPDVILREDEVDIYLPVLVIQTRYQGEDNPQATVEDTPFNLSGIYNEEAEASTHDAYPLGFARFGFGSYR